ncbi:hypothetical protein FisN_1Hh626 [Fistulifera solaris]|uniref:Uncharacterized protein n=1 Tax=Fistulifera solaris TaxID=1519565 RepID=A0A1Z5KQI8_FISSO|nr:hypothetical protein FisN_1Hh626 [Fistulifera solaris]|eukprot:GAX28584.1 hypothetical protein FisN_1Hh626 [Fistulifera solaris]
MTDGKESTGPPARKKLAVDGDADTAKESITSSEEIASGARRLAKELREFIIAQKEKTGDSSNLSLDMQYGNLSLSSEENIVDLQMATCRKLRELLPSNKELLYVAQQKNWIPLILSWLNLHDRPAVQVESLLALANIAELCAQQSYFQHTAQQSSAVAAAAQAAVSAVKNGGIGGGNTPTIQEALEAANKFAPSKYSYPGLIAPAPGSVPFPPLSFSQTLSPEAVAAFDASLTSTIQSAFQNSTQQNNWDLSSNAKANSQKKSTSVSGDNSKASKSHSWSLPPMPPAPLFPNGSNANGLASTGAINFTSLAPPPGGAHSSVPSNAFLPPPTPVSSSSGGPSFPQHLSASSQHLLLRHADAIPTLISLLSSPSKEVYEQAMWILGSIAAGDSPGGSSSGGSSSNNALDTRDKSVSARDVILAAGVINQLLRCLELHPKNIALQRIGSWTLSNLVDGIFQQSSHSKTGSKSNDYSSSDEIDMSILLPVLKRLLHTTDSETLSYTCWTLSHLCDGPSSHIAAVVTTRDTTKAPPGGLVPRLVELLTHPSWRVTKPALRTIGNIVCAECSDDSHGGTTDYTEVILDCGAVPRLKELVTHSNREIQKEACWTLSNIAAGTVEQIQAVIDSGAIRPLVEIVQNKKTDQEVRSEACWVVLNATSCGSDSQIEVLVDEGCVAVLGVLLSEASMVMMALEGLERVLQVEEAREVVRKEQIERGEIDDDEDNRTPTLVSASLIENARDSHNSSAVTKRAERIWKQHFVSCALYYQEELWAASEEQTAQKKNSKKSKNKKKKEKFKQKKAKQTNDPEVALREEHTEEDNMSSEVAAVSDTTKNSKNIRKGPGSPIVDNKETKTASSVSVEDEEDEEDPQNQIDFVLYLQQTGSIIALAKLMDALEYGGADYDEELDDYERKMIREQQLMRSQTSN